MFNKKVHIGFMKTLLLLITLCVLGCGVKGDPLPPLTPPGLGRGKPTFKKASKNIDIKETDIFESEDDEKEEEE